MNSSKRIRIAVVLFLVVFLIGVAGFKILGGPEWSFFDSVYMTVITVATVGYGEVHDLAGNLPARAFAVFYIIISLGTIAFAVTSITAFVIEGELKNILGRRKMEKEIGKLRDHFIVCGCDETSATIIRELSQTQRPFVVIEAVMEKLEKLLTAGAFLHIQGDSADEDVLVKAGINRARGALLSLPTDEANLYATVTVRSLNPKIRIVAKGIDIKSHAKMERAGADYVVSPTHIGGMRMVSQMIRPAVVTFLDTMLKSREEGLRVEEVDIAPGSPFAGKTVGGSGIREKTRALLVAIRHENATDYDFNPQDSAMIGERDVLIFMAAPESLREIAEISGKPI